MDKKVETGFEIRITEKAIGQILSLMRDNEIPAEFALRITVSGSKHEGFSYRLGFDSQPKDSDTVITYPELKLFIDSESLPCLSGTEIDYNEDGCCGGFVFANPNALNKCSCHN